MLAHAREVGSTRVVTVNFSRLAEGLLVSLCWAQWWGDGVACSVGRTGASVMDISVQT
jgi:hypothetical protein